MRCAPDYRAFGLSAVMRLVTSNTRVTVVTEGLNVWTLASETRGLHGKVTLVHRSCKFQHNGRVS